jgi:hypothetical protein
VGEVALLPVLTKARTRFTSEVQAVAFGKQQMPAVTGKIFPINIMADR